MSEHNAILITGNTYDIRKELFEFAIWDKNLGAFIAPISCMEKADGIGGLTVVPMHLKDFIPPTTDREWQVFRLESALSSIELDLHDKISEKESIEISGNTESQSKRLKELQISIKELKDREQDKRFKLDKLREEVSNGIPSSFDFKALGEMKSDWINDVPPKQKNLLVRQDGNPFLPKGVIGSIVATGGTGKSRLAIQLGFCMTAGINFLDDFVVTADAIGKVFVGLAEEPIENIQRRFRAVADYYAEGRKVGNKTLHLENEQWNDVRRRFVPYSFYGQNVSLIDESGVPTPAFDKLRQSLIESQGEEGYSLIILDPYSRFQGATSEIDNNNATRMVALMQKLSMELKGSPTILMVHHMRKDADFKSQDSARGASGFIDGCRWVLNLSSEDKVYKRENKGKQNVDEIASKLKSFVRGDLVKRNDVPPLHHDIILRFTKEGVLEKSKEDEIKKVNGTDEEVSNQARKLGGG